MSLSQTQSRRQAIVLGGSIAGLMAARVLSNHFENVTIIEKDVVNREPESRKGQPQTRHLHGLLPSGLRIMCNYFPGFLAEIVNLGASVVDFGESMRWYAYGGFKKIHISGMDGVSISRPLLEHLVRERVLAVPNIQLKDVTTVRHLLLDESRQAIKGVEAEEKGEMATFSADLVVDCMGRASRSVQWLAEMGYGETPVDEVTINVGYTSRVFKRDPDDPRGKKWMVYTAEAPKEKRFGGTFPIEGNRWMVTVGGWHGDHASLEEKEYLKFVKSLPNPDIYDIVSKCEPVSKLIQYKFPVSTRKHYEKLKSFPKGYLILGDAISSFNPIYGQGMASACLQAVELDKLLGDNTGRDKLAKVFFTRAAKIVDNIWQMATGEDLRFPETKGIRPFGIEFTNKYAALVHKASIKDAVVCKALLQVIALVEPPAILLKPEIIWRVLKDKAIHRN